MEILKINVKVKGAENELIEESNKLKWNIYMFSLCKEHFQHYCKAVIRKQLKSLYRGADKAYSSMDFTGVGSIT